MSTNETARDPLRSQPRRALPRGALCLGIASVALCATVGVACVSSTSPPVSSTKDDAAIPTPLPESDAATGTDSQPGPADAAVNPPDSAPPGDAGPICGNGLCVLASGQNNPFCIAVDSTNVYWADQGTTPTNGTIMSVPVKGGTPVTLASGRNSPQGLTLDSTNVYWTDEGACPLDGGDCAGAVMKVPLAGGTPTTIAASGAYCVAVDATAVYWTTVGTNANNYADGTVMSAPFDGGAPVTLASAQSYAGDITVDSTNVYWTDLWGGNVMKVPKTGGTPSALATGQSFPFGITVDSASVYWATNGDWVCPDGGQCAPIPDTGTVMSAPLDGGASTLLASGQSSAWIAVDSTSVYWNGNTNGTVLSVPKGGGTPVTLASGQNGPGDVAVDSTSLYWGDNGSCDDAGACTGAVMRFTPK